MCAPVSVSRVWVGRCSRMALPARTGVGGSVSLSESRYVVAGKAANSLVKRGPGLPPWMVPQLVGGTVWLTPTNCVGWVAARWTFSVSRWRKLEGD